jgi:hypothetical protein
MLRYIEALMNRVRVRGDDLRHHRQRHDLQVRELLSAERGPLMRRCIRRPRKPVQARKAPPESFGTL